MEQSLSEHVPHVFRLALRLCRDRLLAEDLTQDTMLKAIEKRDQLDERTGYVSGCFEFWQTHGRITFVVRRFGVQNHSCPNQQRRSGKPKNTKTNSNSRLMP